jgi:hypothetical protein
LIAHVCARPAIMVDLCDAAAFIDMHGDRTRLWVTIETAVKRADRDPHLIDQATKTLENALRREGMLDQQPHPCELHSNSRARYWNCAFQVTAKQSSSFASYRLICCLHEPA